MSRPKAQAAISEATIASLTAQIQAGDLKNLPKKVLLDFETASLADYEALLELVRYKSFGHRALKAAPELPGLQAVRSLVHSGRFTEALSSVDSLDHSDPEVLIEKARGLVFVGKFESVEELLLPIVANGEIPANTRGVASQLIGHALLERSELVRARRSLETALELAEFAGNTLGSISARLFLGRVAFFDGNFLLAEQHLACAFEEIFKLGSFRWYLGYYRNLSHLLFLKSDLRCLTIGKAAMEIASTLGDELFRSRGAIELIFMRRRFGMPEVIDEKMLAFAKTSESDLSKWIAALDDGIASNYSLGRFIEGSKPSGERKTITSGSLLTHAGWIYDRERAIFIDLIAGAVSELPERSPFSKLLPVLNQGDSPLSTADVFEKAWGLSWSPERHQNVLDVALHRLNKSFANLKVIRENSAVRLSVRGIVI